LARVGEAAGGKAAGSDDPDDFVSLAQWQQACRCRLDQLIVVERGQSARVMPSNRS
jgi:hypothetical protein